ncbi:MAG TPA: alanine racemase [Bacillota bacterium]|nr:alanine racemase [Bacillota bacterium]
MLRRTLKRALARINSNKYIPLNRIELNAANMLHNVRVLRGNHAGKQIIPVLKGNAYGHGLRQAAQILQRSDCEYVAVDGYFEAGAIRDIVRQRIIVMGYILPANAKLCDTRRCSFVIQDIAGLRAFGALPRKVRVHLELNTGMNRLGLSPDELDDYLIELRRYPNLQLEGVMTHLADADNEVDNRFTRRQVEAFDQQLERIQAAGFKPSLIHVAQTAGSTKAASKYANAIRLGIGLYGIQPLTERDAGHAQLRGLKPVLELKSTIIKVLDLQKGDKVSYNCTFTAPAPMKVAVLPLGYYEGVPRALSNRGVVSHGKKQLPIVGRICMDHTMFDVTGTHLQVGDEVTVISADSKLPNSVLGMQQEHQLFAYNTLTSLASSVRREIV